MSISTKILNYVRTRAEFACEYCGVTEVDSGGKLTVDHFRPKLHGGSDELINLVYCCPRCNTYKHGYWPQLDTDIGLWNPRVDLQTQHLVISNDGRLHPLTEVGKFSLQRLRLNRPQLIAHRFEKQNLADEGTTLAQLKSYLLLYEELAKQQQNLIEEQQRLLKEQQQLIQQVILLN